MRLASPLAQSQGSCTSGWPVIDALCRTGFFTHFPGAKNCLARFTVLGPPTPVIRRGEKMMARLVAIALKTVLALGEEIGAAAQRSLAGRGASSPQVAARQGNARR